MLKHIVMITYFCMLYITSHCKITSVIVITLHGIKQLYIYIYNMKGQLSVDEYRLITESFLKATIKDVTSC